MGGHLPRPVGVRERERERERAQEREGEREAAKTVTHVLDEKCKDAPIPILASVLGTDTGLIYCTRTRQTVADTMHRYHQCLLRLGLSRLVDVIDDVDGVNTSTYTTYRRLRDLRK